MNTILDCFERILVMLKTIFALLSAEWSSIKFPYVVHAYCIYLTIFLHILLCLRLIIFHLLSSKRRPMSSSILSQFKIFHCDFETIVLSFFYVKFHKSICCIFISRAILSRFTILLYKMFVKK